MIAHGGGPMWIGCSGQGKKEKRCKKDETPFPFEPPAAE